MIIAIDGLGVNGKSTLAKMLSEKLNKIKLYVRSNLKK